MTYEMRTHIPTHADLTDIRKFALSLRGASEDFPFGHSVIKVNEKVFAFLGTDDAGPPNAEFINPAVGNR